MIRSSDFPKRARCNLLVSLPDEIDGTLRIVMRNQARDDIDAMMRLEGHWHYDRTAPSRFGHDAARRRAS